MARGEPFALEGKTVFVAGHRGMVGSAIVRRLASEHCTIVTAPRSELDLKDQVAVRGWFDANRPDAVFLAAAKVGGILANSSLPADFLYDNLMIEANIIEAAHRSDVAKLMFLGSSCIYPKLAPQPITEDALLTGPLEPTNEWYAVAKIAGIKLAQAYRRQYGRDFISAMPTNLYGPGDNFDLSSSHVLPALIRKAHEAKRARAPSIEIWGTGTPRREFLHVDDLADACIFLMKTYSDDEHVNVGSGEDLPIVDLARLVCDVVGYTGEITHDLTKPDGTPRKLMSAAKLRALGWSPRIGLREGIEGVYRSYGDTGEGWFGPTVNVLVLGLNYAPEPVGIGPYTAGMAAALAAAGHHVTVVCGKPYYPAWKVDPAFAGGGVRRSVEDGVRVVRVPLYVPAVPNGRRRLLHHASFTARAQPVMLAEAKRARPDVVIGIAPSLISTSAARTTARAFGAKLWLHIQDFEVEAAFATGLLSDKGVVARSAVRFETVSLKADRISTISPQMCAKLIQHGIEPDKVVEFRNWASVDRVVPLDHPSPFRAAWGIDRPHVALYSGNIANKQGIEIIVEAARLLVERRDLTFAICGEDRIGERLVAAARECDNVRFFDLQPMSRLSDLLGLASVHLLPQIAGAADLVLPSKLTNMLASGRPVIATASPGSGLAHEVDGVGLVTEPEDAPAFAAAIVRLLDDDAHREELGRAARQRAEERWSKSHILARFERELRACVDPA